MFRHWITSIDYKKLIEMQAKEVNVRISKSETKNQWKNINQTYKKSKVRKMGKQ